MVDHPEFAASAGAKVRTPIDDYVATVRALGIRLKPPVNGDSFVNAMYWQYRDAGQAPYEWPAPNGFPEVNGAWTSTGRILSSLVVHRNLAAKWWPTKAATFRSTADWMPRLPATVEDVIDHVALQGARPEADRQHQPRHRHRPGLAALAQADRHRGAVVLDGAADRDLAPRLPDPPAPVRTRP